jgi:hypothetical protein
MFRFGFGVLVQVWRWMNPPSNDTKYYWFPSRNPTHDRSKCSSEDGQRFLTCLRQGKDLEMGKSNNLGDEAIFVTIVFCLFVTIEGFNHNIIMILHMVLFGLGILPPLHAISTFIFIILLLWSTIGTISFACSIDIYRILGFHVFFHVANIWRDCWVDSIQMSSTWHNLGTRYCWVDSIQMSSTWHRFAGALDNLIDTVSAR